jgi:hypothetical protein
VSEPASVLAPRSLPLPPPPATGSPRYFALLYCPAAARPALSTLLALADEISAGAGRGLDHSVAHLRLDWWRAESERYRRGEPQHPWLRALLHQPGAGQLMLQPLVDAAALDLATETLAAQAGANLQRSVFELAEAALRSAPDAAAPAAPAAPLQRALRDLGQHACELERFAGARLPAATAAAAASAAHGALEALRRQAGGIDPALQPRLTPLLVWIALAARQARRRWQHPQRKSGALLDAFADNIVAWNAARRAARGRFRID